MAVGGAIASRFEAYTPLKWALKGFGPLPAELSEDTEDAIGGTINEIVNENGWKLLFQHPFGWNM